MLEVDVKKKNKWDEKGAQYFDFWRKTTTEEWLLAF